MSEDSKTLPAMSYRVLEDRLSQQNDRPALDISLLPTQPVKGQLTVMSLYLDERRLRDPGVTRPYSVLTYSHHFDVENHGRLLPGEPLELLVRPQRVASAAPIAIDIYHGPYKVMRAMVHGSVSQEEDILS